MNLNRRNLHYAALAAVSAVVQDIFRGEGPAPVRTHSDSMDWTTFRRPEVYVENIIETLEAPGPPAKRETIASAFVPDITIAAHNMPLWAAPFDQRRLRILQ